MFHIVIYSTKLLIQSMIIIFLFFYSILFLLHQAPYPSLNMTILFLFLLHLVIYVIKLLTQLTEEAVAVVGTQTEGVVGSGNTPPSVAQPSHSLTLSMLTQLSLVATKNAK